MKPAYLIAALLGTLCSQGLSAELAPEKPPPPRFIRSRVEVEPPANVPNILLNDAELELVLKLYQESVGRTLLRSPLLPRTSFTLRATRTNQAQTALLLEKALGEKGITTILDGDKFVLVVPTARASNAVMCAKQIKDSLPIPTHPGQSLPLHFSKLPVELVVRVYAELILRKIDPNDDRLPRSGLIDLESQTPLTVEETRYALDMLFRWQGFKIVPIGETGTKVVSVSDDSASAAELQSLPATTGIAEVGKGGSPGGLGRPVKIPVRMPDGLPGGTEALETVVSENRTKVVSVSDNSTSPAELPSLLVTTGIAEVGEGGSPGGLGKSVKMKIPGLPGGGKALEMVVIAPGTFMMGSSDSEKDRYYGERPRPRITISKGFLMGKYEITQGQWEAVMGNNPSDNKSGPDYPVENVSWEDASAFCRKLTDMVRNADKKLEGIEFRLPTDAEWEYACRAGTTTATAYGDSLSSTQANFDGNYPYGGAVKGPDLSRTAVVGSYQPNAWGLYDMHGNVWEWCLDESPERYPGGSRGSDRLVRGGSWNGSGRNCLSANRRFCWPKFRCSNYGFRVVLAPGQ